MRFLVTMVLVMGLLTTGWGGAVFLQSGRPTLSSQWIADAYAIKTAAAQKIAGAKILIVSGSSALFGVDSKLLADALGLPVVNYGVNGGLLLPYVLLKSQSVLNPGDVVIMPLEYHFYTYDGIPNVQMIDQIWSRDPTFFGRLNFSEQVRMVWMVSFERMLEGFWARGGAATMCGPYGYRNIDENGDQMHTSAVEAVQWAGDWERSKKDLPRRYGRQGHHPEAWTWLERYWRWAKGNGIRVIVMPPPMMDDPICRNDPHELRFYQGLKIKVEAFGVSFVGNPYDYMYHRRYFFNTHYHLNDEGRAENTRRMIKDLIMHGYTNSTLSPTSRTPIGASACNSAVG